MPGPVLGMKDTRTKSTHQRKQAINESISKYNVMSGNEEVLALIKPRMGMWVGLLF